MYVIIELDNMYKKIDLKKKFYKKKIYFKTQNFIKK